MDLKALYEKRAALLKEREALLAKEQLTDDDVARDDKLAAEVESINSRIARVESVQTEQARKFAALNPKPPKTDAEGGIEVSAPGFVKDPKKGFREPKEFFLQVLKASEAGRVEDERLKFLKSNAPQAAQGSDENMRSNDAYGGFLLPEGFSPNLLTIADEDDPFAGRTTPVDMQVPELKIPARVDTNHATSVAGGLTVSRKAETIDAAASRVQFEQVRLEAAELVGAAYATEQLLRFSPMSFVSILQASFAAAFRAKHADEMLNGTGTSGEFLGIIAAPCTVSQTKETSQTAATIKYENVIKMRSRVWGYSNAIWVANHDTLPELMTMNFTASAIAPIWQPSAREDAPSLLLGRPIFFSEYAATLGTVGDIGCYNLTQYLEGTLMSLESAESIHVRFLARERTFRFVLMNAGAPWWKSALTPAKSSTTLSPFVVLETRA